MDSDSLATLFGTDSLLDPAVALDLNSIRLPSDKPGPLTKVQFMIEIVGPRSVPSAAALSILDSPWREGLGEPEVYVMGAMDSAWRAPMRPDPAGSLDSIVLVWDYLSRRGSLCRAAAERLLQTAERFANGLQRRAMPLPTPDMVDRIVATLQDLREGLDIGFEVGVAPVTGDLIETEIWRSCLRLGLQLAPDGTFGWRSPKHPLPLLTVASWDEGAHFSLSGARAGSPHSAIGVGFNVPTCPDPEAVLKACFHVAQTLANAQSAVAIDDEGRPYDAGMRASAQSALQQAIEALRRSALTPGSRECLKLFSE